MASDRDLVRRYTVTRGNKFRLSKHDPADRPPDGLKDDADFAAKMRGYFERELKDSQQITPALHRQRANLLRRIKWTLSYWLVTSMDYTVTRRLNFVER